MAAIGLAVMIGGIAAGPMLHMVERAAAAGAETTGPETAGPQMPGSEKTAG
jgi:hypothetical protein